MFFRRCDVQVGVIFRPLEDVTILQLHTVSVPNIRPVADVNAAKKLYKFALENILPIGHGCELRFRNLWKKKAGESGSNDTGDILETHEAHEARTSAAEAVDDLT